MDALPHTPTPEPATLPDHTPASRTVLDYDALKAMTDQEIIKLVPEHKEAFAVLIRKYEGALLRYIRRLGLSVQEDQVDVLQNSFIKAYRNIQSFDTKLSFSSWIYRITHNETVSFFRARKSRPEGNLVDDAEDFMERIQDDGDHADILSFIDQKINADHVNAALARLDDKYRTVLILRYFEEREYGEISDILQVPPGSVATLIHRAKKQLAKELKHTQ